MNLAIPFRPKLGEAFQRYSSQQFWRDFGAGVNVAVMAFPLSVAFAIASGAKPEQGLFTAIIGGGLIAALSGSPVQIGGPTGAFVVITYSILQRFGSEGLVVCMALAGVMLCVMGFARLGSVIRFIPYPVSRAFTLGIAVLILSSQIRNFLGLEVEQWPVDFLGKLRVLFAHWETVQPPTVALALGSRVILGLPPAAEFDPLRHEREKLETARRELTGALERANDALQMSPRGSRAWSADSRVPGLGHGHGRSGS